MTAFDETQHPRAAAGTFTDKPQSAPDLELNAAPRCTEGCGNAAEYRYANIPRGYRTPGAESVFCGAHAAKISSDGGSIEEFPRPQEPGETIVWLIEGDDHEYELVEASTEDAALDIAAERFEDRYSDEDDEDEDEDEDYEREPVRDLLRVAGTFRGEVDGYTDELDFVPYSADITENDAYAKLQYV